MYAIRSYYGDEITAQQASAQEILYSLTTAAEELEKRGEVGETILT